MTSTSGLMLTGKFYDRAKFLVQIVLPAIGSLYFGLDSIWDLPKEDEIVGTLALLCTFLGVVLQISSKNYNDSNNDAGKYAGDIVVFKDENNIAHVRTEFNQYPEDLAERKEITLKVVPD